MQDKPSEMPLSDHDNVRRPSRLLVVNSVLFIGYSLYWGGFWLADLLAQIQSDDGFSAILATMSFLFAAWQFRATFRGGRFASVCLALALIPIGLLVTMIVAAAVWLSMPDVTGFIGRGTLALFGLSGPWLLATGILAVVWCWRLHTTRAEHLDRIATDQLVLGESDLLLRRKLAKVMALFAVVAGAATERHLQPQHLNRVPPAIEVDIPKPSGHDVQHLRLPEP